VAQVAGRQPCEVAGRLARLREEGITSPTSLKYDEALDVALAYGWIDGQGHGRDAGTYAMRFTPRRSRSVWSKRNTIIAERLISEGLMRPAGQAEIERAKADGRWAKAYEDRRRSTCRRTWPTP